MARKRKQILPFRIPFFRIFYSTTYTVVLIITLCFLAITPGTALVEAIQAGALQYVFIIGGVYVLTAVIAIFIYMSRLYNNRIVLAAVGKAYIPIEADEIGKKIRAMIVSQLNRSAVVSWEAKPRDVMGEVLYAEKEGLLPEPRSEKISLDGHLGSIVPVDINSPPWGDIQHRGWTAPSLVPAEYPSSLHFDVVIAELPHLLEAKAVGLAPINLGPDGRAAPDPSVVEILRRQERAGLREYLTQLSFLRLVDMAGSGASFVALYEQARFSGVPPTYEEFGRLMTAFAAVMEQMTALDPAIINEIHQQVHPGKHDTFPAFDIRHDLLSTPEPMFDAASSLSLGGISPVTAQTRQATPYLTQTNPSQESMASVLHNATATPHLTGDANSSSTDISLSSDAGSVLRYNGQDSIT